VIEWLVKFGDRQKLLAEIKSPELLAAIAPVQKHIAEVLGPIAEEFEALKVIFTVDPEWGLKFTLRGPALEVNQAIDRIGSFPELRSGLQ
jgi:hypothetical protein